MNDPGEGSGRPNVPFYLKRYFTIHSGACKCTEPVPFFHAEFAIRVELGGPPPQQRVQPRSYTSS
jgi:hypothetical protein